MERARKGAHRANNVGNLEHDDNLLVIHVLLTHTCCIHEVQLMMFGPPGCSMHIAHKSATRWHLLRSVSRLQTFHAEAAVLVSRTRTHAASSCGSSAHLPSCPAHPRCSSGRLADPHACCFQLRFQRPSPLVPPAHPRCSSGRLADPHACCFQLRFQRPSPLVPGPSMLTALALPFSNCLHRHRWVERHHIGSHHCAGGPPPWWGEADGGGGGGMLALSHRVGCAC
jgi:hypothetical protein